LERLVTLIEAYEKRYYDIPLPDIVDTLVYYMETRGLSHQDMEPYIGDCHLIREVLNREHPLSSEMIQKLHTGLGIPAEMLMQHYECEQVA
jgi:HTH-type transcriptional regulator/antitoxin HigA